MGDKNLVANSRLRAWRRALTFFMFIQMTLCYGWPAEQSTQAANHSAASPQTTNALPPCRPPLRQVNWRGNAANGIVVREMKLYDTRSLQVMLDSARANLANLKFFDQSALTNALGRFQGAVQTESTLSLTASTLPTPGTQTQTLSKAGVEDTVTKTVTQDKVTPGPAPTPTPPSAAFTAQLPFGVSAQDILAEQTALTYQVINLSLLLERAVTDKVVVLDTSVPASATTRAEPAILPRAQATVGLEIGIETPPEYKDMVAEVEVVLTSVRPDSDGPPSAVALIPREKTYNVATVSKKSTAFGGGAVVQVLNVGFNTTRSRQTLYLIKDTDTVAFQRFAPLRDGPAGGAAANTLTFGWQFRPVLGQKAVTPGARQVFALLAMPNSIITPFIGRVEVHTHWRRYKTSSNTVGEIKAGSENTIWLTDLVMCNETPVERQLGPGIAEVAVAEAGNGQLVVDVTGTNFTPASQTKVLIGDLILDTPERGLAVLNDRQIRFVVNAQKLAAFDPLLIGPFGVPAEIVPRDYVQMAMAAAVPGRQPAGYGLADPGLSVEPLDSQRSKVTLTLRAKYPGALPDVRSSRPIIAVGNKVYGLGGEPLASLADAANQTIRLEFVTPSDGLRASQAITVKYPFLGRDYEKRVAVSLAQDLTFAKVTVLSSTAQTAQLAIAGSGFTTDTELFIGRHRFVDPRRPGGAPYGVLHMRVESPTLILVEPTQQQLSGVKQLVFRKGASPPLVFQMEPPASLPEPKVASREKVFQGDVKEIKLVGENLDSISRVFFEDQELAAKADKDGKSMTLRISRAVSDLAGDRQLTFVLNDGAKVKLKDPVAPDKFLLVVEKRP